MGKMLNRRRKAKKSKKTVAQLKQALENINKNQKAPTPPVGFAFKSKKDYDRKTNKKIIEQEKSDDR